MYSRLSRLMTLFAILICLPLQGLAAVTMPSCQAHGQKMEMQATTGEMADMSHCDHHHNGKPQPKKAPCDKCFACYLSTAQAIIPFVMSVKASGASPMNDGLTREIPEPVPSSLFHPPRSILARC
ncbi:conserved exported protein of unknown function [Georgfuchsia toluolica]|uniref:Uncharacterized protein n=1 Tax=Georgfuchsia toluolica TaxID=424218 RepID=A0A916J9R4_9PROT|nr:hypothetical protein [Georgfuchsia toluolica]CAG4884963.1 conserved exported protein of unknown function [Georgfuchsia toluolica]